MSRPMLAVVAIAYLVVHPVVAILLLNAGLSFLGAEGFALLAGFAAMCLGATLARNRREPRA